MATATASSWLSCPAASSLQSQLTNYFLAQQKLTSKVRDGAKVTKRYDRPTTPHRRAERHEAVAAEDKTIMNDVLDGLNPAAIHCQIQTSPHSC